MENMTDRANAMRNTMRNTSVSWPAMKLRTTSTSEVQRCTMSPVWLTLCQDSGRRWIW